MHILGIQAGGLRYHGMAPLVSTLHDAVAVKQLGMFEAAVAFTKAGGIIPAPELAHAIH